MFGFYRGHSKNTYALKWGYPRKRTKTNKGGSSKSVRTSVQFSQRRGGARNFPSEGLTLPTRVLKYGFLGTINAKNLRKNRVSPSDGGL